MLVDVVVVNGEVLAAKPEGYRPAPIIMITLVPGVVVPTVKWINGSCDNLKQRLQNRTYGHLKGKALEKALEIIRENGGGGLNISGEYGSTEIRKQDFKPIVEPKQQPDSYQTSPEFQAKEAAVSRANSRNRKKTPD